MKANRRVKVVALGVGLLAVLSAIGIVASCLAPRPAPAKPLSAKAVPLPASIDRLTIGGVVLDAAGNPIEGVEMIVHSEGDFDDDNRYTDSDVAELRRRKRELRGEPIVIAEGMP